MMDAKMTFEKAKELSMIKWKEYVENPLIKVSELIDKHPELRHLKYRCGFCEYYWNVTDEGYERCPLYWSKAHPEPGSAYTHRSLKCCREFWKWIYWAKEGNEEKARYWALRVLEKVEESEECE